MQTSQPTITSIASHGGKGREKGEGKNQTGDQWPEDHDFPDFEELGRRAHDLMIDLIRFVQQHDRPKKVARTGGPGGCGAASTAASSGDMAAPNNCTVSQASEQAMGHGIQQAGLDTGALEATELATSNALETRNVARASQGSEVTQEITESQENDDTIAVALLPEECETDPSYGGDGECVGLSSGW